MSTAWSKVICPVWRLMGDDEAGVASGMSTHPVVEQLLAEGVGAELEIAAGAWEQVGLHPRGVVSLNSLIPNRFRSSSTPN
jgi:hypothetical protein